MQVDNAHHAASLSIAEQYLRAFSSLAKEGNTLLLPSNVGDPAGMVGQALGIFNTLSQRGPFSKPSGCAHLCLPTFVPPLSLTHTHTHTHTRTHMHAHMR